MNNKKSGKFSEKHIDSITSKAIEELKRKDNLEHGESNFFEDYKTSEKKRIEHHGKILKKLLNPPQNPFKNVLAARKREKRRKNFLESINKEDKGRSV